MKSLLTLLLLFSIVSAGNVWVDHYSDCVNDTKSAQSMLDTYYGNSRVGVSFEQVNVFLNYYQYGMYGPSDLLSYFGVGIKKGISIKENIFIEPFLIVQRDFEIKDNSVWFGFYFNTTLKSW